MGVPQIIQDIQELGFRFLWISRSFTSQKKVLMPLQHHETWTLIIEAGGSSPQNLLWISQCFLG